MREFIVNGYLSLKLENGLTNIYIKEKKIRHCKFLLINIPIKEITSLNEIISIDEATEKLSKQLEDPQKEAIKIPLETEFWGHCSNLQVWAENEYNANLLHRNLAFPLLKELVVAGDPFAKKALKKEIIKRFSSGHFSVINYLIEERYLDYLNSEELNELLKKFRFGKLKKLSSKIALPLLKGLAKTEHTESIKEFEKEIQRRYNEGNSSDQDYIMKEGYLNYLVNDYLINELKDESDYYQGSTLPRLEIKFLKQLDLVFNKKNSYLFNIEVEHNHIIKIEIMHSDLKIIPESIGNLDMLKHLNLKENQITNIPESIGKLKNLRYLYLDENPLKYLPESIGILKSIEKISLLTNHDFPMPTSLRNLESLKELHLICWRSWYNDALGIFKDLKKKGVDIHWFES